MDQWMAWLITLIVYVSSTYSVQLCPRSSTTFVQMIGYKAIDRLLRNLDVFDNRTVSECHDLCLINDQCVSFFADNVRNQCFLVNTTSANLVSQSLEKHTDWSFHRKVCPPTGCEAADVQFELLSGSLLVTNAFKVTRDLDPHRCLELCKNEPSCLSVNIDYKKGACSFSNHNLRTSGADQTMEANPYFNYFEKICLPVTNRCTTDWAFERVKGKELVGMPFDKVLVDASSREECEAACLEYQAFPCRSAEYNYQMNECRLSPYNRFSSEDKRVRLESSASLVDYLENNCAKGPRGFCSWKIVKQNRMVQQDRIFLTDSIVKCQEECLHNPNFTCRSFTYDSVDKTCSLNHHTHHSILDTILVKSFTSVLYEVSACFDVQIRCEADSMVALVKTSGPFHGRIFALSHPYECFNTGHQHMDEVVALSIPLHAGQCGTISLGNGTYTNSLVIQKNPYILRESDRRIDIACDYHRVRRKLRGGKNVAEVQSIAMTRVITGLAPAPPVHLRIMNSTSGKDVRAVELGDNILLKVEMTDQSVYGIFGSQLIAQSGDMSESILLIDDQGCPLEPSVFPSFTQDAHSKSLVAPFQAFRFATDSEIRFQMIISFCLDTCQPAYCGKSRSPYENGYARSIPHFNQTVKTGATVSSRAKRSSSIQSMDSGGRSSIKAEVEIFTGTFRPTQVNSGQSKEPKISSIDDLKSGDILNDVTMETSFYVIGDKEEEKSKDKFKSNTRNTVFRHHQQDDDHHHHSDKDDQHHRQRDSPPSQPNGLVYMEDGESFPSGTDGRNRGETVAGDEETNEDDDVDSSPFIWGFYTGNNGLCFSPFLVYSACILGCVSQFSILLLCLRMIIISPTYQIKPSSSPPSSSISSSSTSQIASPYEDPSICSSISSKIGFYSA
ncbi:uncharacterized protein LOC141850519 [Brevipalpus obovatus]|uniref:uncharacterized protein LOC141850519 n=1 Tax=Brevipalpus obovatus TaxID=246614 RepID=UPI003D9DE24B